ncbi:MAG: FxsA family protein [Bacteroidota bacterium]|nr:FxsA family protein [Bacteroidota bacterium]
MPWLFLLFVLVPALELYLLIQIGSVIGAGNTFLLILATGLLGSWLAKTQGLATWRALNQRFSRGEIPGTELMDGAIILVCGALLLTPGVLTDAIGLLGLIPVTRMVFRTALKRVFTLIPAVRVGVNVSGGYNRMRSRTATGDAAEPQKQDTDAEPFVSGSAKSRPSYTDTT